MARDLHQGDASVPTPRPHSPRPYMNGNSNPWGVVEASRLLPFTRSCDTLSNGLIGLIFSKHISNLACTSAGEGRSEDRCNKYTYYNAT